MVREEKVARFFFLLNFWFLERKGKFWEIGLIYI